MLRLVRRCVSLRQARVLGAYANGVVPSACLGERYGVGYVFRAAVESVAPAFEINARRLSNKLPLVCRIGMALDGCRAFTASFAGIGSVAVELS